MNSMNTPHTEQEERAEKNSRGLTQQTAAVHGIVVVVEGGFSMSKSFKARSACSRCGRSVGFV